MSETIIMTAIICFTVICVIHMATKAALIENEQNLRKSQNKNDKEEPKNDDQSE